MQNMEMINKFLELTLSQEGLAFYLEIKKSFDYDDELILDFIKNYLIIRNNGNVPDKNTIYSEFVVYFTKFLQIQGENKILEQFAKYASYYLMLKMEYVENQDFARSISVINAYEAYDAYPFLMEVLDDYKNNRIDDNALINMLNMVEELVFKRHQTGEDVQLNTLGVQINKMLFDATKTQAKRRVG